jgi:hypothetical protein
MRILPWVISLVALASCSANDDAAAPISSPDGGAPPEVDGGDKPANPPAASNDSCESVAAPACPRSTAPEGKGLVAIDRCAFPMSEGKETPADLIAALEGLAPRVSLAEVLADVNRTGIATTTIPGKPAGVSFGFQWAADDAATTAWIPQGISGSADASEDSLYQGKRVVLVSWYNEPPAGTADKGVRVAVVDTTGNTRAYRFALLVTPTGTVAAPSFAPINVHAGGIVWFKNWLYVADTTKGFRIFDLTHILKVASDQDKFGCEGGKCRAGEYAYAIPQVGTYSTKSKCDPLYSYVSLDRTTSPPALVTGDYCSTTACSDPLAGRVFRWPLDAESGRLAKEKTWPESVYLTGHRQVQGGASYMGTFFLSSSAPAADGGELFRVKTGASAKANWADTPEDLMIDPKNKLIYSLSEVAGARAVFAAKLASYRAP